MGGLRKDLPYAFWGIRDWRLLAGRAAADHGRFLQQGFDPMARLEFAARQHGALDRGIIGVLLTSLYMFRLIFLVFYGERNGSGA